MKTVPRAVMEPLVRLPDLTLTDEQEKILLTCPPPLPFIPNPIPQRRYSANLGKIFRITAAAGAGKTTTLLALALKAYEQGHTEITYLTFTKAAAEDGRERILRALEQAGVLNNVQIHASTLHSAAYQQLRHTREEDDGSRVTLWDERRVNRWINEECHEEIEAFLAPCFAEIRKRHAADRPRQVVALEDRARRQVGTFIYKSLISNFCQKCCSLLVYQGGSEFGRDYYPAVKFHAVGGDGQRLGFDPDVYDKNRISFYAKQAVRLFEMACTEDIFTFDFYMKRAQLQQLPIPGTILLVDESQDMDGCQINWVAKAQVRYGKHVYVVGDPAQAIYGFRGAKSQYLMDLRADENLFLVGSFRFGSNIANIANCALFAKHKSSQTGKVYDGKIRGLKTKNWFPYRVRSACETPGVVSSTSFLHDWMNYEQITVISRANITLFVEMIDVLSQCLGDGNGNLGNLPKVHILGEGQESGRRAFSKSLKMIEDLKILYMQESGATMRLPLSEFPDFAGIDVTFRSFEEECDNRELNRYSVARTIVKLYGNAVTGVVERFKLHILDRLVSAEDANIILCTCHTAKGLEWDTVQVCSDFCDLCKFQDGQFDLGWAVDEINLIYVACTRAKSRLSIPDSIGDMLQIFDEISGGAQEIDLGKNGTLDHSNILEIRQKLVDPLRSEFRLERSSATLVQALVLDTQAVVAEPDDRSDEGNDATAEESYAERSVVGSNDLADLTNVAESANDGVVPESQESSIDVESNGEERSHEAPETVVNDATAQESCAESKDPADLMNLAKIASDDIVPASQESSVVGPVESNGEERSHKVSETVVNHATAQVPCVERSVESNGPADVMSHAEGASDDMVLASQESSLEGSVESNGEETSHKVSETAVNDDNRNSIAAEASESANESPLDAATSLDDDYEGAGSQGIAGVDMSPRDTTRDSPGPSSARSSAAQVVTPEEAYAPGEPRKNRNDDPDAVPSIPAKRKLDMR